MSKCSKCKHDFVPKLKSNGLIYETCDRCREFKNKIYAKNKLADRITCECGCPSSRKNLKIHQKSVCHQKLMEEKNKLQRNLTDVELDVFFRTNYPGQNDHIPKHILVTSYAPTDWLKQRSN